MKPEQEALLKWGDLRNSARGSPALIPSLRMVVLLVGVMWVASYQASADQAISQDQVISHDGTFNTIVNNNGNPEASSFITGLGTWQVNDFSFWMQYQETVTAHLYGNAGGSPGLELWMSSPVQAGSGPTFEQVHFIVSGLTLTGGTRYWLGMTVLGSTYFAQETNVSRFATSGGYVVLSGFQENKGNGWADYNPGHASTFTFGVNATVVPEPSPAKLGILFFGLMAAGAIKRRAGLRSILHAAETAREQIQKEGILQTKTCLMNRSSSNSAGGPF